MSDFIVVFCDQWLSATLYMPDHELVWVTQALHVLKLTKGLCEYVSILYNIKVGIFGII